MVIALVGLTVVNIPILTKMGLAAAGTVIIAVLIALTLIPALLGFAGRGRCPARPVRRARRVSRAKRAWQVKHLRQVRRTAGTPPPGDGS